MEIQVWCVASVQRRKFATQGVVFVTCNRRLGAEGFLHLQDSGVTDAGTNVAVLDQIEVLRWVQKHIRVFGGDPDNITLFGHGEGAALIQALVATPASDGLLHALLRKAAATALYPRDRPSGDGCCFEATMELARISSAQLAALYASCRRSLQDVPIGRSFRKPCRCILQTLLTPVLA